MKILAWIVSGLVVLVVLGLVAIFVQNKKVNIDLGLLDSKLKEIPDSPNCVSTQTSQDDKRVEPMVFKGSLEETKKALKDALQAYGSIVIEEEKEDYIYAIATTGKMKYHDDIEIYFDQEAKVIQFRSASRAGYSDMGLNRERYDAIAASYESAK